MNSQALNVLTGFFFFFNFRQRQANLHEIDLNPLISLLELKKSNQINQNY